MDLSVDDQTLDLQLASGRIRARRIGPSGAPLTFLIHGLSAHLHAFDDLVEKVASPERQLVALDLRGRGRSEVTPAGSYGLLAHGRDLLEAADQLGVEQFDLVGWSMGALIGIRLASLAPQRLGRLVLIDHAGSMDPVAVEKITKGLGRLDLIVAEPADYTSAVRAASGMSPWTPFWERYFSYELGPHDAGFKPTTDRAACLEDLGDVIATDWPALWPGLAMPTLLVRCQLPTGGGFIVPASVRDALIASVATLTLGEFDCDHYTIMTDAGAGRAIDTFLGGPA